MSTPTPLPFVWDGEVFQPISRYFARRCDEQYAVGQRYVLEAIEERSAKSHKHFFAEVREIWMSLPEHLAEKHPSPEHLRKYALVMTGFRNVLTHVEPSHAAAQRLAAFIRPLDEFAVVRAEGATVTVMTAQSQSMRAMGKDQFQASKTAVLEYLSDLIGVAPAELQDRARAA